MPDSTGGLKMESLVEKVSSYNILNFLLPGATFLFLSRYFTGIEMVPEQVVGQVVIAYFVGLILSRTGSLILEELLKATNILKKIDYKDYIETSRKDEKISTLLETCNMYRTFAAGSIVAVASALLSASVELFSGQMFLMLMISLLLAASFIKQHSYITKRVAANKA
jgi:hypothetical protein